MEVVICDICNKIMNPDLKPVSVKDETGRSFSPWDICPECGKRIVEENNNGKKTKQSADV